MQSLSSCRGVMIGQGNEPQWEQGGAQSGGAETCLPSETERQMFVWLGDLLAHLHLSLTPPQPYLSQPLISVSDKLWHYHYFHNFDHCSLLLSHSVTFIFPLYWAVFFYNTLHLSLSALLMSHSLSLTPSEIFLSLPLPTAHFMSRVSVFNVTHLPHSPYILVLFLCVSICSLIIFSFIHTLFYNLCLSSLPLAGAHWRLFLWSGHQPATRRFSASDWSHALHRDPGPHDFGHLLCLQWLLCSLCGHQEWTPKEGAYHLISSSHPEV